MLHLHHVADLQVRVGWLWLDPGGSSLPGPTACPARVQGFACSITPLPVPGRLVPKEQLASPLAAFYYQRRTEDHTQQVRRGACATCSCKCAAAAPVTPCAPPPPGPGSAAQRICGSSAAEEAAKQYSTADVVYTTPGVPRWGWQLGVGWAALAGSRRAGQGRAGNQARPPAAAARRPAPRVPVVVLLYLLTCYRAPPDILHQFPASSPHSPLRHLLGQPRASS